MILDQEARDYLQLMSLYQGLSMEVKHNVRMWKGRTAYAVAKERYGLKGNRQKVLAQVTDMWHQALFEKYFYEFCRGFFMEAQYQRDCIEEWDEVDTPELREDFHDQYMAAVKEMLHDAPD